MRAPDPSLAERAGLPAAARGESQAVCCHEVTSKAKFSEAFEKVTGDADELRAFHDFPGEHRPPNHTAWYLAVPSPRSAQAHRRAGDGATAGGDPRCSMLVFDPACSPAPTGGSVASARALHRHLRNARITLTCGAVKMSATQMAGPVRGLAPWRFGALCDRPPTMRRWGSKILRATPVLRDDLQ